jgi:hypothetical protein
MEECGLHRHARIRRQWMAVSILNICGLLTQKEHNQMMKEETISDYVYTNT